MGSTRFARGHPTKYGNRRISVELPSYLFEAMQKEATMRRRSISKQIVVALELQHSRKIAPPKAAT